ncbi:MAG: DUF4129 domain-containing protein [Haloarculaceae archaeon]
MRETLRSTTLAGLAVLAVALAAATLDSTVAPEGPDQSGPTGPGGEGRGGLVPLPNAEPPIEEATALPFPSELLTALGLLVLLLMLAYVLGYYRRTFLGVLVATVLLGLLYLLLQSLFTLATPPDPWSLSPGDGRLFGGAGGGGGGDTTPLPVPSLALLFVLVLAVVAAVVGIRRATPDDGEEATDESEGRSADVVAVGRVAGRAADRIGGEADVENEVYRAWREMTELLDVDEPGTSTPGEFAAAATEAGLGREDVGELTHLFEDVRYGERPPSPERERRATAVFRRIEDRYAGGDP